MTIQFEFIKQFIQKANSLYDCIKSEHARGFWNDDVHDSFSAFLNEQKNIIEDIKNYINELSNVSQELSSLKEPSKFQIEINQVIAEIDGC